MSNFEDLLGQVYDEGRRDCLSILRIFLDRTYDIQVPNFARPTRFWEDPNLDLYGRFASQGFVPVIDRPIEVGDILLMPLRTPVNSHAAIVVGDNQVLHHLPGRLSGVDPLRPRWANLAMTVIRHPRITAHHLSEARPVEFQEVFNVPFLRNPSPEDEPAEPVGS